MKHFYARRLLLHVCGLTTVLLVVMAPTATAQQAGPTTYAQLSAGAYHVAALDTAGTIWLWGRNDHGQLGDGTTTDRARPAPLATPATAAVGTRWTTVVAGTFHSAALRSDGTLWLWGDNSNGQLGDSTRREQLMPIQVRQPYLAAPGTRWAQVTLGASHTVAIRSDSTLWSWGANYWGQLGDNTTTIRLRPVPIVQEDDSRILKWTFIVSSDHHTLGLIANQSIVGSMRGWGRDRFGQTGNGGSNSLKIQKRPSPSFRVWPSGSPTWSEMVTGEAFSLALTTNGALWACGDNFAGQLGGATPEPGFSEIPVPIPVPPTAPSGTRWAHISARGNHALALLTDGTLWSWGENFNGQLGLNSTTTPPTPVQEYTRGTWRLAVAGTSHALALTGEQLFATGANDRGQFGDGTGRGSLIFRRAAVPLTATLTASGTAPYALWPNPISNGNVRVVGLSHQARLQMLDAIGRQLPAPMVSSGSFSVTGLPHGLYFVRVLEPGAVTRTLRLVVE